MKRKKSPWSTLGLASSFVVASSVGAISVIALRKNNLTMLELRDAVLKADETGEGVQDALLALQTHVATHMNSNPPKLGNEPAIQLKASYDRAKKAETDRISQERVKIGEQAMVYCEEAYAKDRLSVRANCIIDYSASKVVVERQIVADLYRYDYSSPRWTPDLAGWTLIVSLIFAGLFIIQLLARIIATLIIKK